MAQVYDQGLDYGLRWPVTKKKKIAHQAAPLNMVFRQTGQTTNPLAIAHDIRVV